MLQRIINKYFKSYREKEFVINVGETTLHLNSPRLWKEIRIALIRLYNYKYKFKTATVSLKEIKGKWDNIPCEKLTTCNPQSHSMQRSEFGYDWDALRESISTSKTYGYLNIRKLAPLHFDYNDHKLKVQGYTYRVINGNHRIAILKCLYGLDYKIKIKYNVEDTELIKGTTIQPLNSRTDLKLQPIKVKLKEVEMDYPNATLKELQDINYCYENHIRPYPWKKFIKDIKIRGMLELPIVTAPKSIPIHSPFLYTIWDGNHRIKALELLYGKEYEVDVYLLLATKKNLEYIAKTKKIKKENINKILTTRFKDIKKKYIND
tara:strand:+ start:2065 stop:3024 length:960 start_codon:yes stop_codon:yes gene_type:complete